jgi:hypothetical protein
VWQRAFVAGSQGTDKLDIAGQQLQQYIPRMCSNRRVWCRLVAGCILAGRFCRGSHHAVTEQACHLGPLHSATLLEQCGWPFWPRRLLCL